MSAEMRPLYDLLMGTPVKGLPDGLTDFKGLDPKAKHALRTWTYEVADIATNGTHAIGKLLAWVAQQDDVPPCRDIEDLGLTLQLLADAIEACREIDQIVGMVPPPELAAVD